jgi:hypothetical protein
MFDDYMPSPPRQDASLGWIGFVASIVVTLTLVRVGVMIDGPVMVGPTNSVVVMIRGEGMVEVTEEGRTNSVQYCSSPRCLLQFPPAAKGVIITHQPRSGAIFQSWGGACAGSDTWCHIPLGDYKTVRVSFEKIP